MGNFIDELLRERNKNFRNSLIVFDNPRQGGYYLKLFLKKLNIV